MGLKLNISEYEASKILWEWLTWKQLDKFCFHVSNEGRRSLHTGARLKAIGLRAGVSDYFIGLPRGRFHGCFLELKVGKNKLTKAQYELFEHMATQDYYCAWATGFDEAKQTIETYLAMK